METPLPHYVFALLRRRRAAPRGATCLSLSDAPLTRYPPHAAQGSTPRQMCASRLTLAPFSRPQVPENRGRPKLRRPSEPAGERATGATLMSRAAGGGGGAPRAGVPPEKLASCLQEAVAAFDAAGAPCLLQARPSRSGRGRPPRRARRRRREPRGPGSADPGRFLPRANPGSLLAAGRRSGGHRQPRSPAARRQRLTLAAVRAAQAWLPCEKGLSSPVWRVALAGDAPCASLQAFRDASDAQALPLRGNSVPARCWEAQARARRTTGHARAALAMRLAPR